jgi:pSer/pThr/pTyr-binding forkhead associated (FHA) protein
MEMIIGRHGTQKINITDPTVSRQHCKLTSNNDGTFTLENLSNQGTKVDGVDVIRTTVKLDSKVQLSSTFSVTVAELLGVTVSTNGLAAANGEQKQVSETNGKQAHV